VLGTCRAFDKENFAARSCEQTRTLHDAIAIL